MRRLSHDELHYIGQLTRHAAEGTAEVWSQETGHVTPRRAMEFLYDTDDQDLQHACDVPGLMSADEQTTCNALGYSMEQVLDRMDDAHAHCFSHGETALLEQMNSITLKTALFRFIATFKDELAAASRSAA